MNAAEYLSRIGLNGEDISVDERSLRMLQHAHLLSVPFENLDIHWHRPITLDRGRFFAKIVREKRGGFCYELNGLFDELLKTIGFETRLISARVGRGDGTFSREFDHAAIIVSIDGDEFLSDVGFGDFAAEPLRFVTKIEQNDANGIFRIDQKDGQYTVKKYLNGVWNSEYRFTDSARDLSEFAEMCDFQQHSPESHFTKGKLCSIMTTTGRKTLTNENFVLTEKGTRNESPVGSEGEFDRLLEQEFGISAPASGSVY